MNEQRIPVWIDTDTGVDDAAALLVACKLPQLDIRGISAVAGNVEVFRTFDNARKVCALAGRAELPVYRGAEKPLCKELRTAPYVHGVDGLGGVELPPSSAPEETLPAWDALYAAAKACGGELQVAAIGPLTNLATALFKYPDLKTLLKRILIMGGAAQGGNVTPAAEFNIFADPHAAQAVFKSGVPVVMCGLDVTMSAYLSAEEIAELGRHGTPVCRFFQESTRMALAFNERITAPGLCLHDVCPILYLSHPQLFAGQEAGVYVETQGAITMGKTVTDLWSDKQFPEKNAFVVLSVERDAFASLVCDLLKSY
jgi:inosine-uridine nucleoside N-ribohydrolase